MSFEPTPTQALLVFGLLARHGECPQAELMPAVKKADREALVKARLVGAAKVGRGLYLRLEDAGWGWAGAHLAAELPPAQRTLSDMLARLGEHLAKSGKTLADFIGSKPKSAPAPSKTPAKEKSKTSKVEKQTKGTASKSARSSGASRTRTSNKRNAPGPASLRERIEAAYLAVTDGRKDRGVKLSLLRAQLSDLDRATLDAGLSRILEGDPKASLIRHDDPRQIDAADRAAAFSPAGEPFHVIWISS